MRIQRENLSQAFDMEVDTKWLTINTEERPNKLVVQDPATASLRALGNDKLSLVMIHGQAKTGKSFLMNKLMGQPGFFAVRAGNDPTTVGVDLSPFKSYTEFTGRTGGDLGQVGFVDVEGQGDRGADYDVMLTAPLLLVSKAVVFNWRGKMAKDDMLNKLGVLAEAARKIRPDGNAKGDYRIFGHLHIVMRDQPDIEGVHEALFELEECSATDEAAEARNKIRKIVRQSFASYRVWGFPSPVDSADRLARGAFNEANTDAAFNTAVGEFKAVLAGQLKQPLVLCGRTLSAADVAEFVPLLADAMNAGQKEIVPRSLFLQVEQRRTDAAADAAIQAFHAWEKTVPALMPMAPAALAKMVEEQMDEGLALIEVRLVGVSEDMVAEAQHRFDAQALKSKAALKLTNDKHIGLKVDTAKRAAFNVLERLAEEGEKRREPAADETLKSDFETKRDNALIEFDNALEAFGSVDAVTVDRSEVTTKAAATWLTILNRNKLLREQAEEAARLKKKAEQEEKAKKAEEARKQAEEARNKEEEARNKAGKERQEAEERARAASAAGGSCGGGSCGGGGYSWGGYSDYDSAPSYGGRSSSSHSSSSSFSRALYRQAAGTMNSRGSVSTGTGYTIDRNGRWHDSRGRFCKNPYK